MSSTRGLLFTAPPGSRTLADWADSLNLAAPGILPAYAPDRLVARFREGTGRGIFVKDGCTIAHGERLALYSGLLTLNPSFASQYLLELPPLQHGGRVLQPYLDASFQCSRTDPPPTQAALLNHKCENPTMSAQWIQPPGAAIPLMVCVSRDSMRGGSALTYNYDAHLRTEAYTVGADEAAAALLRGVALPPCLCQAPGPCPGSRFMPHPAPGR